MKVTPMLALAATLLSSVLTAQIPITTVNTPAGSGPVAPQPQLVPCVPTLDSLNNTSWGFFNNGGSIAEIGNFSVTRPASGRGGLLVNGTLTMNRLGTVFRLISFVGSIDYLCLAGTNIAAAGTLQIADGIGGQIMTWSYPITATIGADRSITYAVTSTSTLNLRRYGALDPVGVGGTNGTDGYSYGSNTYASTGTATLTTGQLPCPVPPNSVLDTLAPLGYSAGAGTSLVFKAGTGPVGTVTGNIIANGASDPQGSETGSYQVYPNCTGFTMNIPYLRNGVMVGANFEGVFVTGNFSRFFILPHNVDGIHFTFNRN